MEGHGMNFNMIYLYSKDPGQRELGKMTIAKTSSKLAEQSQKRSCSKRINNNLMEILLSYDHKECTVEST